MSTRKVAQKATRIKKVAPTAPSLTALGIPEPATSETLTPAVPPARLHPPSYHWPLLLADKSTCDALLQWFEGVEEERQMPWRKAWIDPTLFEDQDEGKQTLAKRAYEVWVSEIMLQQTRVSTVIPYFNNWISKWPTVQSLANASHDDVLSVWKGLGYYSRATRLHQSAQDMIKRNDKCAPIPNTARELEEFSGIGRYTAGAISSIAFGKPEPVLDGNVARVLSRQLGLFVDVKDKKSADLLWEVADHLIKKIAGWPEIQTSQIPGQWNQALMELGSTICTPRPQCGECPVRQTCRAYGEGEVLLKKDKQNASVPDIEDACTLCDQLDTEELVLASADDVSTKETKSKTSKKRKVEAKSQNTISRYFTAKTSGASLELDLDGLDEVSDTSQFNDGKKRKASASDNSHDRIANYCSLFPKRAPKKKVAEEECVVCMIRDRSDDEKSRWLIEQRPAKGLLASLWQFPQSTLPASTSRSERKSVAQNFVSDLSPAGSTFKHIEELGSLIHVFTHLKLTMHVQHFEVVTDTTERLDSVRAGPSGRKWVDTEAMDGETLSTGMRRCWYLMQKDQSNVPTP
ncbi:DNA glycosylase [Polyplosphaeria fusca]|uniref:Adenine DNA glycosylase n=1 Tax=Polyplosphaeria fusca TaxID=682080 RepID=A0A9P4UXI1_9PLEO|nr:DNA glycosylase [Polyplosphaeria fusca]